MKRVDCPDIKFSYSESADVLFISLGSYEPSYSEEVDDLILVERGMFTNELTGFRVLGVKQNNIGTVNIVPVIRRVLKKEPTRLDKIYKSKKRLQSNLPEELIHCLQDRDSLQSLATT